MAPVLGMGPTKSSREELQKSLIAVLSEALKFNRNNALEAAGPRAEELLLSSHSWWWNPQKTSASPFLDIQRSTIYLPARSA